MRNPLRAVRGRLSRPQASDSNFATGNSVSQAYRATARNLSVLDTSFLSKTWTLVRKNLTLCVARHWLTALVVAFLGPVIFMFFIAYSKNFFIPPAVYGIGSSTPLRNLTEALHFAGSANRNKVAFVTNGLGSEVSAIIDEIVPLVTAAGFEAPVLDTDDDLLVTCPSSVRGTTTCFAAASFQGSPSVNGSWAYSIRADGAFGAQVFVNRNDNDAQIYVMPLQFAIDSAIAKSNGTTLPNPDNYPFTIDTEAERDRSITRFYMKSIINVIGVAYFVGLVGVLYQLTGLMATERETGISQLIEVMTARRLNWEAQAMRLLAYHLAFDILYLPGWIFIGVIVDRINFPTTNAGVLVVYFILNGLAESSWAIFCAAFFRKAQLSGISVALFSVILAVIAQVKTPTSSAAIVITAFIFPPMNFMYFVFYMAYTQRTFKAADLLKPPHHAPWQVPGCIFFLFAVIHTLVFPFLGAWVERKLYASTSSARNVARYGGDARETVRITGLTKRYSPSRLTTLVHRYILRKPIPDEVVAVNDLSMVILKGELSVILGANGAGKSTTMDMLAGLQAPNEGTIEIDGQSIGICPQKNVLWDELTCEEHVRIFHSLKTQRPDKGTGTQSGQRTTNESATRTLTQWVKGLFRKGSKRSPKSADHISAGDPIRDLLIACDLKQKLTARSETLSGGQKRKLQLAMMLTGGTNICLLDEVSSGLDPLSRRKIWDILLKERGNRSLLFSTHFLDEADYLSDTITILSKGQLVARGSAVELKQMHGGGYRVKIYNTEKFDEPFSWAGIKKLSYSDHVVYHLPDSAAAADFAAQLEKLGLRDYRVDGPTVEDVFLKLAAEASMIESSAATPSDTASGASVDGKTGTLVSEERAGLELTPGKRLSLPAQTWVLFRKRFTILKRNYFPYLCATLIPIIVAAVVLLFLKDFSKLTCSPADQVVPSDVYSLADVAYEAAKYPLIPVGPSGAVSQDLLTRLLPEVSSNTSVLQYVNSIDAFNSDIDANYSLILPGGFYLGDNSAPTLAWVANELPAFALLSLNLLNNAQLDFNINTTYQSFDTPWTPATGESLQAVLYFGLSMCLFPAFFALYPTQERINKVRALHWSNGVRVLPLWSAYTLFDLIFVIAVSAIAAIVFATVSDKLYFSSYLFLIFVLYGLASMLLAYILTAWSKSQLAAFAIAAGYSLVWFLVYFMAYLIIITFAPTETIASRVVTANFILSIFSPSCSLMRTLLIIYNEFALLCSGQAAVTNPGLLTVLGGPILYLIVQSIIYFCILIIIESGWTFSFRRSLRSHKTSDPESSTPSIASPSAVLDVSHITKSFSTLTAVDDLSFSVPTSSVYALLGPNGAGKSTTFSLIRGDLVPDEGDIHIAGTSIVSARTTARLSQGVCPQFDAMDLLTVREHLDFYARARGVADARHNVDAVIAAIGLTPYADRLAQKLSGGNKRKLSLGIALVGDPAVLLIDEGSSGMDAAAKRAMWATLRSVAPGRAMVLSTHAMEEADALASKVGIMAGHMLDEGSADDLRRRWGEGWNVHLVHSEAPHTSAEAMARLRDWVEHSFKGARVEERGFHGQLRFVVPKDGGGVDEKGDQQGISALLETLERGKEEMGVAFFAVNQPTLDSVFLAIVGKHNVQEENYKAEHPEVLGPWGKTKVALRKMVKNA